MDKLFASHPRVWRDFDYVYPVISRRSRGVSIGVNLNIDKACNFDCIYCCVDRSVAPKRNDVDLHQMIEELDWMITWVTSGRIWEDPHFESTREDFRRLNDIAFSGDGEPTAYSGFAEACEKVAVLKQLHQLDDTRIVVITNGTLLHKPSVQEGLDVLDKNNGEYWVKLDAGTEDYYQKIERTGVPLAKVLENIVLCGKQREIVIQSLFMCVDGEDLPDEEYDAYINCLQQVLDQGAQIKDVQLYTVARQTAVDGVTALSDEHVDSLKKRLNEAIPGLPCDVYYGVGS